ncbi:lipoprotein [Pseudomaricurvus alkylphenolicus]|jgi:predicted small lipoprotein YifL|nr:lipoprotein [Pseudomaricurvus alkylphenolicus]NIB39410.1 lipoprotein [Pseudomaricurvus alkylphenolicus]
MKHLAILSLIALFAVGMAGCGQKGPLRLPQPEQQSQLMP